MFSIACEYGFRKAANIAFQYMEYRSVSLKEIAGEIKSPMVFIAKILKKNTHSDIVDSVTDAAGGFEIARSKIDQAKLADIVNTNDRKTVYEGRGSELPDSFTNNSSPVYDKFVWIRNCQMLIFENTSLYEMTVGFKSGLAYLKR